MLKRILSRSNSKAANKRLLFILFAAFIILIAYFLTNAYFQMLRQYKDEVLAKLKAVTNTGAILIDGDLHQHLVDAYPAKDGIQMNDQDILYYNLQQTLQSLKINNQLSSDIYTIVFNSSDSTFYFIGTSSQNPYYRHTYKNYPNELLNNYTKGGVLDVYEDENGMWLSAFAPIKNSRGQVVALLEADEHFDVFLEKAKADLIENLLVSLFIAFPFAMVLFGYVAVSLNQLRDTQEQLEQQNDEIKMQNEEIRTQSELIERHNIELNERVKERTADLVRSHQQLSNFLYHSSHDIQAPIATLKGILKLAGLDQLDTKSIQYFQLLQKTTAQLEEMTKTIQLVYEIKSRELILDKVNPKTLLENLLLPIINDGQTTMVKISGEKDVMITTDMNLLETSLKELTRNAIQYQNKNDKCLLHCHISTQSQWLHIEVDDNGDGIDKDKQSTLFTLFNRGHENSTGTGLGLYIAKTCIERLQGSISFIPKAEKGSKFLLRLPL